MTDKICYVIVGPTAVGKTDKAFALAQHYKTSIISADSRQCFKELNAGVSKPSKDQLQQITHYFVNSHGLHDNVNAHVFEHYALDKVQDIFKTNDIAILVGGTGLYIRAFCEGLDFIPSINPEVRNGLLNAFKQQGWDWLQGEIIRIDPLFAAEGEIMNPQRIMRALEVKLSTGKSILEYRSKHKKERPFTIKKVGISMPRPELNERIDKRVEEMVSNGLVEEIASLYQYRELNALQTVGYSELFDHLDGKISMDEAVKRIKINTHRYAKRQMTWFSKDPEIKWLDASSEFIHPI